MGILLTWFVLALKKIDLASAAAVRLTKLTGKSEVPVHPKHFLTQTPWFTKYIKKNDRVLDLGCGNGQNTKKAAKIAKKVVGIDLDENSLALAKKSIRLKNITFKKVGLEKPLPFKDASFNKVLFLDVLEHLEKRDQALDEAKRVLVPGGLLFLAVPNSLTSWKKLQRKAGICSYSDPDHKIEFTPNSIGLLLKRHKFIILKFGYGKFDIPARGAVDVLGAFSLSFYKLVSAKRAKLAQTYPNEASGFEIVAQKI